MSIEELTAAVAAEGEAAISDTMGARALALNQLLIDTRGLSSVAYRFNSFPFRFDLVRVAVLQCCFER